MAKLKPVPVQKTHEDESPINLERIRQSLPQWLQRFLPSGGGFHQDAHGQAMFGFTIFLVSESLIFVSLFVTYILLRNSVITWVPPGVKGPQLSTSLIVATVVLLSSSFVIYFADRSIAPPWQYPAISDLVVDYLGNGTVFSAEYCQGMGEQ